jgi:predicted alpha/beta hydrolase family esterase
MRKPVLVGHSFGASVLLKYLAETVRRPGLAGLFLVATPFWGSDFPEFALPPDFGARLRDLSPIYLYHSRDGGGAPSNARARGRSHRHGNQSLRDQGTRRIPNAFHV